MPNRLLILLVDDDANLRAVIAQTLEFHGYEVVVAENAEDALRVIADEKRGFLALISDFHMPPGNTGVELILEIDRGDPKFEFYVLVSGHLPHDPTIKSQLTGKTKAPIYFLPKPFQQDDLIAVLERGKARGSVERTREAP